MKILVSGVCGFVGSAIAKGLLDNVRDRQIIGVDNLSRAGSQVNLEPLRERGITFRHADIRSPSDLESIGQVDWIIDAAANPSVLAGVDGSTSSRQLLEHNLYGTVNLLEVAKTYHAGFTLLSTSRVYSVKTLSEIPVVVKDAAFAADLAVQLPQGASEHGIAENFSTAPPVSLYGASKLASEAIALEYGEAFDFPVWINRCGVLAGAGQFGHAEQGIFSFWINAWLRRRPLKYIGFDGAGHQSRDCFHPRDLLPLLEKQFAARASNKSRILNLGGGVENAMSLAQLSRWCEGRFGAHQVAPDTTPRAFDVPWLVMDSRLAGEAWDWRPTTRLEVILQEIAQHAESNPDWLQLSSVR
ncbi:MAG TPA: NAD-dependent epimerase/dehydratase family protein [Chthoniobacterales bacterium]|nr:NAD-dependent epimerase/dehydratase family protein [Chthoniobacterales bacterium]